MIFVTLVFIKHLNQEKGLPDWSIVVGEKVYFTQQKEKVIPLNLNENRTNRDFPCALFPHIITRCRVVFVGTIKFESLIFPSLFLYLHRQLNFFCRVTYVFAFLLLLAGAALNDGRGEQSNYFSYYECYVLKPGVFAFATIVGAASLALGLFYFLILNSAKNDPTVWSNPSVPPQANIAMAQPQFPPPPPPRTADPVFVHEDTYMRRQFTWLVNVGRYQMR